nr:MMPL family transporter [Kibdelosporangium sp. MJ126-NF4]CEL22136.1 integral membrane protein [Kibdelosporangium sp. MJ126-NF4]CTQ92917.1 integral membrane protein [Kibdelosporangium sp. MJ126-NF4]
MLRKSRPAGAFVERVAGWSSRRRGLALLVWFGLVGISVLASVLITGKDVPNIDPGEAGVADSALRAQSSYEPQRENVLIQGAEAKPAVDDLVRTLRATGMAGNVRSPFESGGEQLTSADGQSYLVTLTLAPEADRVKASFGAVEQAVADVGARHPGTQFALAGDRSLNAAVDQYVKSDLQRSHVLSLPVTLLILLVVFGSLVAAGIPVLLTITVLAASFSLIQVVGKVIPINSSVSAMILLIGVAVGVDYSLFYLRRVREERLAGRDMREALRITARTSGHTVMVSGLTLILSLAGLLATGLNVFRGATVAIGIVVLLAMVGSITVLPAVVSLLGDRLNKGRIPWLGRGRTTARESRAWSALARAVVRRPLLWGGTAAAALVLMAVPAFGMHLQDAGPLNSLPRSVPAVDAATRMQEAFPGAAVPTRVVVWGNVDRPEVTRAVDDLSRQVGGAVTVVRVDQALVVRVPLPGSGTDPTTFEALDSLRQKALPAAFGHIDDVRYAVGGKAAVTHDFNSQVIERSPWVFAFVLTFAFVLLLIAFRSVLIPIVSIALNLLSIGAAYGVLTLVFQYGYLSDLLGFTSYGGVVGWFPLFMFVLLFGLSMDYHIFILSRIRERQLRGGSPQDAIISGVGASAGVVSSAAIIMTTVFAVFITLTSIENKMLGVGLSVAVLIDATVVRGVLLPAALSLMGRRTSRA